MSDPISRSDAIGAKPEYRNEDMLDKEKSTYNKGWNDCNDAWVAIIKALPSADAVHIETYRELYEKYVELKHASAEAVPHGRLIDADALYKKATDLWDKSDSEDFEKGIFKLILNAVSAQTVQCGKENEFIQILKSWETNKVDAISKRFVSDAILQKISELNAQVEKAIPIAREFIRFKRFVDGLTPIRTYAVQGWIPCSERLPDVGEDVLATDIDGDVDIEILTEVSRSDDIMWEDENGFYTDFEDIIAWMPLPEPYKGE